MRKAALNGLMFNLSWLAIVCTHHDLLALCIVCAHLAVHFACWNSGWREVLLVAGVSLAGLVLDHLLFAAGVLVQSNGALAPPLWLSCLWPVFATTLLHLFAFLHARPLAAAMIGAVGGTASYLAGTQLSDIAFASNPAGPALMALIWALLMPLLLLGAARLEKSTAPKLFIL